MDLRRGINIAVDAVVSTLKSRAKGISTTEEIAQVGPSLVSSKQLEACFLSVFFMGLGIASLAHEGN